MSHRHHRPAVRTAIRTGAVALTLAGMLLAGTGAWASEATAEPAAADTAAQGGTAAATEQAGGSTAKQGGTAQQGGSTSGQQGTTQKTDDEQIEGDGPVSLYLSTGVGRPGTKVEVTVNLFMCDLDSPFHGRFYDHRALTQRGHGKLLRDWHAVGSDTVYRTTYTVGRDDAPGEALFKLDCKGKDGKVLTDMSYFDVRAAAGTVSQTAGSSGAKATGDGGGSVKAPSRIDTGLGGAADGAGDGPSPAWLVLPGAALLIGLATWLLRAGRSRS
ncbi:MAG TPA: hypothetical protein VKG45_06845 [Actinomycetes bacterium]|nr:hypothetical protein [Actinomycetes bacterium]